MLLATISANAENLGLQRFGTFGFGTDAVGIALLQSNYLAAVNGILSFKPACLQPDAEDLSVAEAVSKDDRYVILPLSTNSMLFKARLGTICP